MTTQLEGILTLLRAGLSDAEIERVLRITQRLDKESPPEPARQQSLPLLQPGRENAGVLIDELVPEKEVFEAAVGMRWHVPHQRLANATRGSKLGERLRDVPRCIDVLRQVFRKRHQLHLVKVHLEADQFVVTRMAAMGNGR
jgi:hypothetical protein